MHKTMQRALPALGNATPVPFDWRKIQAEAVSSALTHREWVLNSAERRHLSHAVLISSGRARIGGVEGTVDFIAPHLLWLPPRSADRLRLNAGCSGHLLGLSDDLLASAIGNGVDSAALHYVVGRKISASAGRNDIGLTEIKRSLEAIERELARTDHGSWTSLAAHITLLVVGIWRLSGIESSARQSRGPGSAVLQRFRYLVELHFRDHWSIPQYAAAIGVSNDRLHALCRRVLGRSPLTLVHDRLIQEAKLLLQRSALSVEQIAAHLGFKDPGHFNRFFKSNAGETPGMHRKQFERSASLRHDPSIGVSYADWP